MAEPSEDSGDWVRQHERYSALPLILDHERATGIGVPGGADGFADSHGDHPAPPIPGIGAHISSVLSAVLQS
jgi:hypothetical protein